MARASYNTLYALQRLAAPMHIQRSRDLEFAKIYSGDPTNAPFVTLLPHSRYFPPGSNSKPRVMTGHRYLTNDFARWWEAQVLAKDGKRTSESLWARHAAYWQTNHGLDLARQTLFLSTYTDVVAPHYDAYLSNIYQAAKDDGVRHNRNLTDALSYQFWDPVHVLRDNMHHGMRVVAAHFENGAAMTEEQRHHIVLGYRQLGQFLLTLPSTLEDLFIQYGLPGYVATGGRDDMELIVEEFRDEFRSRTSALAA